MLCVFPQHWDLNEMGYVETMFGHQSEINAIDSWRKERTLTGGRDRTVSVSDYFLYYHDLRYDFKV